MTGNRIKLVVLASIVISSIGCGKGDYETAMIATKTRLDFGSKFLQNLHPTETDVIKNVASMQLPLYIDDTAKTHTITSKDNVGDRLDRGRVQPPFLNIPGFKFSYERHVEMGGRNNTHPLYCYFGVVSTADQKQQAILASIKSQVGKALKGAVWQDAQLDDPVGGKVAFKKISAKGNQPFEMNTRGGETRPSPGQFDIYVHSTPDHHVIVAFRTTDELAEKVGMFEAAEYAMGTLKVAAAEPGGDGADS